MNNDKSIISIDFIASERDNEGYVERKLQARMDEKINGLADFKASADFARTLNATLQEKMMEANEERALALFTKGITLNSYILGGFLNKT